MGADLNDVISIAGVEMIKRMMDDIKQRTASAMVIDGDANAHQNAVLVTRSLVAQAGHNISCSLTYNDFMVAISKVQPSAKREGFATVPETTWAHIGALRKVREDLQMAIVAPIKHPELFARVGITNPAGVLLYGPPGCGKTLLAKAVANESRANFISIKGPELLNKYVGESERAVRKVFERARSSRPCVLFFDELDALVPKRDDSLSEASSKVVNTLLIELDGMSDRAGIHVIAATNRPDVIDPAMLRPGRLGRSIFVGLPAPAERVEILKTLYRRALPSAPSDEIDALEQVALDVRCTNFSGADLGNLHEAAARDALTRQTDTDNALANQALRINPGDWEAALGAIKASVQDVRKYQKLQERGI